MSAIPALLAQALVIQRTEPALFTWEELAQLVEICDLGALNRHPAIEELYVTAFREAVRSEFASTDNYLRTRLGWEADQQPSQREEQDSLECRYFTAALAGTPEVAVVMNDWSYAIPHDAEHWVVWSRWPVLHPALCCSTSISWTQVLTTGLSGFTGAQKTRRGIGDGDGPGREMDQFVKARWVESSWKTMWFVNPPHLQSVPGLSHFHVLACRTPPMLL